MEQTPLDRAIKAAKSQQALADILGVHQTLISYWLTKRAGIVKPEWVLPIERRFGISRHELRPDLYPLDTTAGDSAAA